jgi:hypothetical protein
MRGEWSGPAGDTITCRRALGGPGRNRLHVRKSALMPPDAALAIIRQTPIGRIDAAVQARRNLSTTYALCHLPPWDFSPMKIALCLLVLSITAAGAQGVNDTVQSGAPPYFNSAPYQPERSTAVPTRPPMNYVAPVYGRPRLYRKRSRNERLAH